MPNNNMYRLDVPTKRGVVLNGGLFRPQRERTADTVMIATTGIHGNFYSNPFYYNIGDTLNRGRDRLPLRADQRRLRADSDAQRRDRAGGIYRLLERAVFLHG